MYEATKTIEVASYYVAIHMPEKAAFGGTCRCINQVYHDLIVDNQATVCARTECNVMPRTAATTGFCWFRIDARGKRPYIDAQAYDVKERLVAWVAPECKLTPTDR